MRRDEASFCLVGVGKVGSVSGAVGGLDNKMERKDQRWEIRCYHSTCINIVKTTLGGPMMFRQDTDTVSPSSTKIFCSDITCPPSFTLHLLPVQVQLNTERQDGIVCLGQYKKSQQWI